MKKEWFEAWFDSPFYHLLYKSRDENEAKNSLDNLLKALDLPPGAYILDLACGKGRHSRYLAEKGYRVTGLDISEKSIAFARKLESDHLEFYQHDMRKPFRTNYFDGVVNMFTSFGYFRTEKEHLQALKSIANNLKPGGVFLLDYFNSQWVRNNLVHQEEKVVDDVLFHLSKWISDDYVHKTVAFSQHDRTYKFTEAVRLFELADFERLFKASNMTIIKTFGSYQLDNFHPESAKRLILVAKKNV